MAKAAKKKRADKYEPKYTVKGTFKVIKKNKEDKKKAKKIKPRISASYQLFTSRPFDI